MPVQFNIKAVVADKDSVLGSHTVYLFNQGQKLLLPIKVGPRAAEDLILALQKTLEPRPYIHDTAKRLVSSLGGLVERVIVSRHEHEIFYSYICIRKDNRVYDIDARPSDAFAIAVRCDAPIFVEDGVLESAGIKVTKELLSKSLD